jgi:hypothetical protein
VDERRNYVMPRFIHLRVLFLTCPSPCFCFLTLLTSLSLPYSVFCDIFRERDTTDQRIGSIDEVIATVTDLVFGNIDWAEACRRLPAYDGVQAVD